MHTQSLTGQWQFREKGGPDWLPAQVPGSVHTDLLALARIPDPFVADNEIAVQWVAQRDWEYRLIFEADAALMAQAHVYLVCDGLDTLADVTLNGQRVGHAENAFRQYRWEITPLLTPGQNELHIAFDSPLAYISDRLAEQVVVNPIASIPGGPHLRKSPSQFGWDWGPQLPPIGIWRDIRLEAYTAARLEEVHVRQHHAAGAVTVSAHVTADRWQEGALHATLRLTAPDGSTQEARAALAGAAPEGRLEIAVDDPQLWWCNDLGAQPLYQVEVTLHHGEAACDRRSYRIGLRTLELRQEADDFGTSFTFVINGVPIFAKGANWIPADSFPTRITDQRLEHLIHSAAEAHMNMLRVWGGGYYEDERFYDLCDRYGILVWQDFMFACSLYPADEAFLANVKTEAVQNIRRLRHRACLALWCGNNEMEWGWIDWWNRGGGNPAFQFVEESYDRLFHHILPRLCAEQDADTPYWPSSPSSGEPFEDPNGIRAGDTHNWQVWHEEKPFTAYRQHPSRFVSEFGFQSLPALETVRTFADEGDWNMTAYVMEHHQRNAAGNGKIVRYLTDHFRLPKDFSSLIYVNQLLQAECVRTGVEFWRRTRQRTHGALYWQLNDCWPVVSWSSIDYEGYWKALHYVARRFNSPVLLSAESQGAAATLYLTNDTVADWRGTVRWSLETLQGEVLQAGEETITAPQLAAVTVCELNFEEQIGQESTFPLQDAYRRDVVLVYELWQSDRRLHIGLMPFVPDKHLALTDPGLSVTVEEAAHGFEIIVSAEQAARFVWLALEGAGPTVIFSDNAFDLPAGRRVTITLPAMAGWSAGRVRQALQVRSLVDSL